MGQEKEPLFCREQVTIRFTQDQADFWNENIELITGTSEPASKTWAIHAAAEKAVSRTKIVEKTVVDPKLQEEIERLTAELADVTQKLETIQQESDSHSPLLDDFKKIKATFGPYLVMASKDKKHQITDLHALFYHLLKIVVTGGYWKYTPQELKEATEEANVQ